MSWRSIAGFELDQTAQRAARQRIESLAIPKGALGRLHEIAVKIAGITGTLTPSLEACHVVVFCADHGVCRRGVSAFAPVVTDINTRLMAEGRATISALVDTLPAVLCIVDIGIDAEPYDTEICQRFRHDFYMLKVRRGTGDIAAGPAMTRSEMESAIQHGYESVERLKPSALVLGEMGIGNTTASSALVSALLAVDPAMVTGAGSGLDPMAIERKIDVVREAVSRYALIAAPDDPLGVLQHLGGLEIAAMVGAMLASAKHRIPVLLDGFIVCASFLVASRLVSNLADLCFAGTRSSEPGFDVIMQHVGLRPILDLEMRLGEGTGALLSFPIIRGAVRHLSEGATLDELTPVGSAG
ncbi:MAG TPA: nicotinate-nucleotide--dimethylbenzimidazole phosphoribosyltransferase [Allosphingosinicella sp.]|nr:nicotinate-nucleotide--dimethylbenzimidazole phosphoribosyltransferase [Allosphingosinicella sp.]